jgi:hypothetical protein
VWARATKDAERVECVQPALSFTHKCFEVRTASKPR